MSVPERGPLNTYEVIYNSGHVEQVQAHQVIMPFDMPSLFGSPSTTKDQRWTFHGEIDGRWTLLLSVPESDVRSVRNVTHTVDQPKITGGAS